MDFTPESFLEPETAWGIQVVCQIPTEVALKRSKALPHYMVHD